MDFEIQQCDIEKPNDLGDHTPEEIPIISDTVMSYNDFFSKYLLPNVPCIVKKVTKNWRCISDWFSTDGSLNLDQLKHLYGSCDVTVYDCNEKYFNSHKTERIKFHDYVDTSWKEPGGPKLKYLKDWHLKNTFKEHNFYEVPIYFASDWLNEYLVENSKDDYRFVYMGQVGTWTPFHADVFGSFSWSANVCGSKKWILLPPGEENRLRDPLNNLPFDTSNSCKNTKHFQVIQGPGEAIFVPSGWHHQVWNLENTVSINHNWVNGCNIEHMWALMKNSLESVKKEISDCTSMDDFLKHCQVMLNASFGIDFFGFYDFISFIGKRRLGLLRGDRSSVSMMYHGHNLGKNHARFDLVQIVKVLEKFVGHEDYSVLFGKEENDCPLSFLNEITNFIEI